MILAGMMISSMLGGTTASSIMYPEQTIEPSIVNMPISAWIIVAGDRSDHNDLEGIKNGCNQTYATLRAMGYTDNQIYYLSPDTGDTGVDNATNLANIQYAVETWAATRVSAITGLGFWLESHGGPHFMCIPPGASGLTDSQLNASLAILQNLTGLRNIIILYDACESGAYIDHLSGPGRIIMTSADETHDSAGTYPGLGNALGRTVFGHTIWTQIRANKTLGEAFKEASWNVRQLIGVEYPLIDDDGNRVGHRANGDWWLPASGDGYVALNNKISRSVTLLAFIPFIYAPLPLIYNISLPLLPIWAIIQNQSEIKSVHAILNPKKWTPPAPIEDAEGMIRGDVSFLQIIELTDQDGDGNYTGQFSNSSLTQTDYKASIYAETVDGEIAHVVSTIITLNENGSAPQDTVGPEVEIINPIANSTINGTLTVVARGDDNQKLDTLEIYIDGQFLNTTTMPTEYPYPEFMHTLDTGSYTNGVHNITVLGIDAAGNKNSASILVTFANGSGAIAGFDVPATLVIVGCVLLAIAGDVITKSRRHELNE